VASGARNHEQVDGLLRSGEAVHLTYQAAIRAAVRISPSARPSGAGRDAAQKRPNDRARVDAERIRESPTQSGHGLDCVDDFLVGGIRVSLDSIDSANDDLVGIESRAAVETEQLIAPDHEVLREALARALCHDFQEGSWRVKRPLSSVRPMRACVNAIGLRPYATLIRCHSISKPELR